MKRLNTLSAEGIANFTVGRHADTRRVIERIPVSSLDNRSIKRYNEEFMTVFRNL